MCQMSLYGIRQLLYNFEKQKVEMCLIVRRDYQNYKSETLNILVGSTLQRKDELQKLNEWGRLSSGKIYKRDLRTRNGHNEHVSFKDLSMVLIWQRKSINRGSFQQIALHLSSTTEE